MSCEVIQIPYSLSHWFWSGSMLSSMMAPSKMVMLVLQLICRNQKTKYLLGPLLINTKLYLISTQEFPVEVQSVHVTTNDMSLNPAHGKVYSIHLYMIHLVIDLQQNDGFSRVFRFLQTIKLTDMMIELKHYWNKRLRISMGSSAVVIQSRIGNAIKRR